MRELEFRGIREDNGEWIYGCYMRLSDNGDFTYTIMADHIVNGKHCWSYFKAVKPESIGQLTGLKDKNRAKLWEGDICKMMVEKEFHNPVTGEEDSVYKSLTGKVVIIPSKGVCIKNPKFECFNSGDKGLQKGYYPISAYRTEVIGNIYQDEHLIK